MRFRKVLWIKLFTLSLFKKDPPAVKNQEAINHALHLKLSANNQLPEYKIVMQEFSDKFNRIIFKLKHNNSDDVIIKTAGEISLDKHLIDQLSREDVCSISFTAGYEQSLPSAIPESRRVLNKYLVFLSVLFLCIIMCNAVLIIFMLKGN